MLTIEKHLQNICAENPQYLMLNSIWNLNKKLIPIAQSVISFNFPHYSLHEKSHSETIVKNIQAFLGPERISLLSPTDSWLILMSAFTHDLGMVVFHKAIEKKWLEEDFQNYLIRLKESSNDIDLRWAATILIDAHNIETKIGAFPVEIRRAVILVTADFFRKNHHERSRQIILGYDQEFSQLLNGFNMGGLPNRFSNILAEIAYGHGVDFYTVFDMLEYEADGFDTDKMHPRFVAYLLRLGDLLDVDDKRFNVFAEKVFSGDLPENSKQHKEKHASIRHLLISPKSIEITANCQSDGVYRIAREWFDWLKKEVQEQSQEWSRIAPLDLNGLPPTISRGKIKILYKNVEPKEELMNLRFNVSNQKAFEIFEGASLYDKAELVFFRETIQNSLDAIKIQVWNNLKKGNYDNLLRRHLNLKNDASNDYILENIHLPSDIPSEIWEPMFINLSINTSTDGFEITVQDNGTGISEVDLLRMTNYVGESRRTNENYLSFIKELPYWLKPTGAFGIGLQSIFLSVDSFTIHTKYENEKALEIVFNTAKNNLYSYVTDKTPNIKQGTKVIIRISNEKLSNIGDYKKEFLGLNKSNLGLDDFTNYTLNKIKNYLKENFNNVSILNIKINNENFILDSKAEFSNDIGSPIEEYREGKMQIYSYKSQHKKSCVEYVAYENLSVGSTIKFSFRNAFPEYKLRNYYDYVFNVRGSEYFVRNIPVDEEFPEFYKTNYCSILWNLESPDSDKILKISRDGFIKKKADQLEQKFLNDIFPVILEKSILLFEKVYRMNNDPEIAIEYFHMSLTARMSRIVCSNFIDIFNDKKVPEFLAKNSNGSQLSLIDFLKSDSYIIVLVNKLTKSKSNISNDKLLKIINIDFKDEYPVIFANGYFDSYFESGIFSMDSYFAYLESGFLIKVIQYKESKTKINLKTNDLADRILLRQTINRIESNEMRTFIYSIPRYNAIAVENFPSYDSTIRNYMDTVIISPFKSNDEFKKLQSKIQQHINSNDKEKASKIIKEEFLDTLSNDLYLYLKEENNMGQLSQTDFLEMYLNILVEMFFEKITEHPSLENFLSLRDDLHY